MTNAIARIRSLVTVHRAIDLATLVVSLGIADRLYVLHQFSLEAVAFLATWYVLRAGVRALVRPR